MVIQHNITAMNSNRQLGITTGLQAKSSEKLSSGYKINRAADDAAGLSISEKMRRQIRGLDQAIDNVQDGISVVQIADGALGETQAILQRINELAVKSANDTLTEQDRSYIQAEVDSISAEVDHIAYSTNFNDAIYPLIGTGEAKSNFTMSDITEFTMRTKNGSSTNQTYDGMPWNVGEYAMMHGLQIEDGYYTGGSLHPYHLMDPNATYGSIYPEYSDNENVGTFYDGCYSLRKSDFKVDDDGYMYYVSKYNGSTYYLYRDATTGGVTRTTSKGGDGQYLMFPNTGEEKDIWIHAGSEKDHGFTMHSVDATIGGLKIYPLNVSTRESSLETIEVVKRGILRVSEYRSYFGAMQNRMEHTVRNLGNVVENTQDAESQIRDTDMAEEMVRYSNNNILAQAGQSMLAQANQTNQGVLALLQ